MSTPQVPLLHQVGWSAVLVNRTDNGTRPAVLAVSRPSIHSTSSSAEGCVKDWKNLYSQTVFDVKACPVYVRMVSTVEAVDRLAQFIREKDGDHKLGAGALAELIIEHIYGGHV